MPLPTPPESVSESPEPGIGVNYVREEKGGGGDVLLAFGEVEVEKEVEAMNGGLPDVRDCDAAAPVSPRTSIHHVTTAEEDVAPTSSPTCLEEDEDINAHQTINHTPEATFKTVQHLLTLPPPQEPCTPYSNTHVLATCGHQIHTPFPLNCGTNCDKIPSILQRHSQIKAYACTPCIGAILRSKHTKNRRAFDTQMERFQLATAGWLENAIMGVREQGRSRVWWAGVLEARRVLEGAGMGCWEVPVGLGLGKGGLEEAALGESEGGRVAEPSAIPIEVVRKRALRLLRSERTQARLRGLL